MDERKKSVVRLFAATALLFAVSAYRQLSMRYLPEDALRSYLVWVVYMLLLFGWQYTISTKITQKTMRTHLTAQNIISILYLTVRFVQDAFLYVNIPWMRFTGYFINIAAVFIPLFGLYGAFYLGRPEDYRISKKWYLLLIPACFLSVMALTNDLHHFFYYIVPNEQQVGEETAGGTAPGTAAGTAPGTAAGTAPGTVPGMAAICASRMDGSGAREIAGDLADPEEAQILIGNGWLVYGFENGDFRGLASVNLKDQTRRQLAVKYRDGLRLLGIDGDSLYIRQMGEVSGQGRDEQGNFFSESAPIQEVIRYDLGTTESQDVVSFSGEDSADGVRGLTVADGILYYWQREAQGRFRFCSLKDKTYVNYPVFGDSGPYAVSEGRVYFADDGAVFSYPLGTEEDWGHVEEIYGNRVFRPEKAGEPKQLAVLPDEAGVIAGLTVSPRGIYVKAQQEGAERTLLYRIPEEDGEPVELLADDEP